MVSMRWGFAARLSLRFMPGLARIIGAATCVMTFLSAEASQSVNDIGWPPIESYSKLSCLDIERELLALLLREKRQF